MKRLILIGAIAGILSLISAYSATAQNSTEIAQELLISTPDDLLTKDQKILKYKICDFMQGALHIEGDKVVTSLTEDDFIREGISSSMYNLLLKDIEVFNEQVKNFNIDKADLEIMIQQGKDQYIEARKKVEL